ncbi:MAG: hypothetical protein WB998_03070 [Solirubrobacteraceae bacterium]
MAYPLPHHRRFAYETHKHDPSRSRRRGLGYGRSRCRYRRRRRRAEFHDEHDPVHEQHGDHAIDDLVEHHHGTVDNDAEDDNAEDDAAAGLLRSSVPEYGQIGVGLELGIRFELGLWLELGLGL